MRTASSNMTAHLAGEVTSLAICWQLTLVGGTVMGFGDTYNAIAGCDKTIGTCASRFSNAVNFRGEPYVPGMDKMLATSATSNDLQTA